MESCTQHILKQTKDTDETHVHAVAGDGGDGADELCDMRALTHFHPSRQLLLQTVFRFCFGLALGCRWMVSLQRIFVAVEEL